MLNSNLEQRQDHKSTNIGQDKKIFGIDSKIGQSTIGNNKSFSSGISNWLQNEPNNNNVDRLDNKSNRIQSNTSNTTNEKFDLTTIKMHLSDTKKEDNPRRNCLNLNPDSSHTNKKNSDGGHSVNKKINSNFLSPF